MRSLSARKQIERAFVRCSRVGRASETECGIAAEQPRVIAKGDTLRRRRDALEVVDRFRIVLLFDKDLPESQSCLDEVGSCRDRFTQQFSGVFEMSLRRPDVL